MENPTTATQIYNADGTTTIGARVYTDLGDPNCDHDSYATDEIKGTWVESTCDCGAVWQEDSAEAWMDAASMERKAARERI